MRDSGKRAGPLELLELLCCCCKLLRLLLQQRCAPRAQGCWLAEGQKQHQAVPEVMHYITLHKTRTKYLRLFRPGVWGQTSTSTYWL